MILYALVAETEKISAGGLYPVSPSIKKAKRKESDTMQSISQVAKLTGISTRTLQYYDEIGLLKPSALTQSGYRLYDDEACSQTCH